MNLYIDLRKAEEPKAPKPPGMSTPAPSNPEGGTGTKMGMGGRQNNMRTPPKVPGSASGSSGVQTVPCPLGAACPDGGKHQEGSARLQEHTQQAQAQMKTGMKPGDESKGQDPGKQGVSPGSQNIGALGSDKVTGVQKPGVAGSSAEGKKTVDEQGLPIKLGEVNDREEHKTQVPTSATGEAAHNATGEPPYSQKQTMKDQPGIGSDKRVQGVPNPLSADPLQIPADSKPMDHYRLSKVAAAQGDKDAEKFHVDMARKRSNSLTSEEHGKLGQELHKEGMQEHGAFHTSINERVNPKAPEEADTKYSAVHAEQADKAKSALAEAKSKHEETKAKATKVKEANEAAVKKHADAEAAYKAAPEGKKPKKPGKPPKLEKEPKVEEKPELNEPGNDAERIQHGNHTERAKELSDKIESHLKNNKDLSEGARQKLERAHKIAAYQANIGYLPTAEHRRELAEAAKYAANAGASEHWDDVQAKATGAAAKDQELEAKLNEKNQAKEQKVASKQEAAQAKETAKNESKPVETPADQARQSDHATRAAKLRANLQSHLDGNPDMPPEQRQHIENVLNTLEQHEQMQDVPSPAHSNELKEMEKLAGKEGKQEFKPEEVGEEAAPNDNPNMDHFMGNQLRAGASAGAQAAGAATDPNGGAGRLPSQAVSYGLQGATSAGHSLLQVKGTGEEAENPEDKQKRVQAAEAKKLAATETNAAGET